MQRTMLKSKIHSDVNDPRVVHIGAHNEILTVDREVATLLAAPTSA